LLPLFRSASGARLAGARFHAVGFAKILVRPDRRQARLRSNTRGAAPCAALLMGGLLCKLSSTLRFHSLTSSLGRL
jgi:hypothetical protein